MPTPSSMKLFALQQRYAMSDAAIRARRRRLRPRLLVTSVTSALIGALGIGPAALMPARADTVRVVVQEQTGADHGVQDAVVRLGGRVETPLPIIDGFSAVIPVD